MHILHIWAKGAINERDPIREFRLFNVFDDVWVLMIFPLDYLPI